MSTFGTVVWVDLRPNGPVAEIAGGLLRLRTGDSASTAPEAQAWINVEPDWIRVTAHLTVTGVLDAVQGLVSISGWARAVVAEDNDEFGACWTVLTTSAGATRTVHRRYILNADPVSTREVRLALADFRTEDGLGHDPRADDVAGAEAARKAAILFGVPPGPVVDAEAASGTAFEGLGVVGGPFPWLEPMGLPWPGPDAGRLFAPAT